LTFGVFNKIIIYRYYLGVFLEKEGKEER